MTLLDAIKTFNLLGNKTILEALTLNADIINKTSIVIDNKKRSVRVEYGFPFEQEAHILQLVKQAGVRLDKNNYPTALIQRLLYSLARHLYSGIAELNQWPTKWVRTKIGGKYSLKDPDYIKIYIEQYPLDDTGKKEHLINLIKGYYLSVKLESKNNHAERIKLIKSSDKAANAFIKILKTESIIDDNYDTKLTTNQMKRKIKNIAMQLADNNHENTKTCIRSGCNKIFIPARSDHAYCSTSCRYQAWREKNKNAIKIQ